MTRKRPSLHNLNLGEQSIPSYPIGFVAGTPILTWNGYKPVEDIKPGHMIQVQPHDDQADAKPKAHLSVNGDSLRNLLNDMALVWDSAPHEAVWQ